MPLYFCSFDDYCRARALECRRARLRRRIAVYTVAAILTAAACLLSHWAITRPGALTPASPTMERPFFPPPEERA